MNPANHRRLIPTNEVVVTRLALINVIRAIADALNKTKKEEHSRMAIKRKIKKGSKPVVKAAPAPVAEPKKRGRKPGVKYATKPPLSIAALNDVLFNGNAAEKADAVKRYPVSAVTLLTRPANVLAAMNQISARKLEGWLKADSDIEQDDDSETTPVKRGPGRPPKKDAAPAPVAKKKRPIVEEEEDDETEDEEEDEPAPRKRGRPPGSKNKPAAKPVKAAAKKSKADEEDEEDDSEDDDDISELLGDDDEEDEDSEEEEEEDDEDE